MTGFREKLAEKRKKRLRLPEADKEVFVNY